MMAADCKELDYEGGGSNTLEKEQDLEEGEILDADGKDYFKKNPCEFYQRGDCRSGDKCPYLHVIDKGLYRMLDSSPTFLSKFKNIYSNENPNANNSGLDNCMEMDTELTNWDRDLIKAQKLVEQCNNNVNNKVCSPVVITIESDDEQLREKSTEKPRRYRSPSPKMLCNCSLDDRFRQSRKGSLVEKNNEYHRDIKWHDPWRRSPIRKKLNACSSRNSRKRSSSNSGSERCSKWPRCQERTSLSILERRYREIAKNQHKKMPHHSSSSSSSSVSMHRSKNGKSKKEAEPESAKQKKKFSPDIVNKLDKNFEHNKPVKTQSAEQKKKFSPDIAIISDKNLKQNRLVKNNLPSLNFTSVHQEKKTSPAIENMLDKNRKVNESLKKSFPSHATPKKVRPVTPPIQSCSDMSTSPLTDSSLSDLFDPDKRANERDGICRHEVSRSRSFLPRKKCQAEVYGPVYPGKSHLVAPCTSKTKSKVTQSNECATIKNLPEVCSKVVPNSSDCATKKKAIKLSEHKQVKKRRFAALEADLLKFQRQSGLSESPPSKNAQQKATETVIKKISKDDNVNQRVAGNKNKKMLRESPIIQRNCESLKQRKQLSAKDIILINLNAIDAAIEKKKKMYAEIRKKRQMYVAKK